MFFQRFCDFSSSFGTSIRPFLRHGYSLPCCSITMIFFDVLLYFRQGSKRRVPATDVTIYCAITVRRVAITVVWQCRTATQPRVLCNYRSNNRSNDDSTNYPRKNCNVRNIIYSFTPSLSPYPIYSLSKAQR